ncbi:MAG: hypothetical protein V4773_28940 [Verrucomicrobiota bacterium]
MISKSFKIALVVLALVSAAGALLLLELDNARLRRQLAAHRASQAQTVTLQAENKRLAELQASQAGSATDAAATARAQLQQAREEVAALERRAAERQAGISARAEREAVLLATNRDPRRGPVRVENFESAGQATPTAAMQTLVWAALKGDAAEIVKLCTASEKTRAQAKALIARLPEEARAQWTQEKLAALWVTGAFTEVAALQITGERFEDANNAVVSFRIHGRTDEEKVKLRLSPIGWQVMLPGNAVEKLEKKMGLTPKQ